HPQAFRCVPGCGGRGDTRRRAEKLAAGDAPGVLTTLFIHDDRSCCEKSESCGGRRGNSLPPALPYSGHAVATQLLPPFREGLLGLPDASLTWWTWVLSRRLHETGPSLGMAARAPRHATLPSL